jgi:hypothetical protein
MVEQVKTISVETELGPIQYNKVLLMYSRRWLREYICVRY